LQLLALVDVFDAEICEEALGQPLTPECREALLQDRLISPLGGERFTLHPALRGLLLRRFPVDVRLEERRKLLRRVGDYYWRVGQSATALRFWIDAGELSWAAERLVAIAEDWLAEGRLEALASTIDALGPDGERVELLATRGELYRRWGDLPRAEQFFARAVELCAGEDQALVRARARLGQAQVAGSRGDVKTAQEHLAEARPGLVGVPRFELDLLILEGGLALLSAETELAIASFRAALDLGRRHGDTYGEGRAMHNLGICYIRQGEFERALECYDSALAREPEDGAPIIWMTPINRALVLVHLGRFAEAEAAAENSLDLVRRFKLTREEGYALRILGFSRLRRGAFESAATCFDSAELLARRANDTLGLAYSLNFRAELAIAEGDLKAATELVEDVERAMGGVEATRGILEFAQTRARLSLAAGREAEAAVAIEDLIERARALGYKHVLDETELMAAELRPTPTGSRAPAVEPVHAPAPPTELRVSCFGGLRVWRADAEVSDREWQTARAKLLLAFFLFNPEGATKAHLLEAVFPQEEISNALMNMTLMRVRKALEPQLEKGQPSRFILRSDGRYSFNLQAHVELDTREFEHQLRGARLGEAGERVALERALALYRGDFLPEFDTRWVVALRHRYQELALKACRRLLAIYDEHASDEVTGLLQRALEIDPVSEEFNRELILRYLEADEPHRALQHFQLCERRFREILDAPPPADLAKLVAPKSS
jgi:DNA-binding SARP family transcriptional activator